MKRNDLLSALIDTILACLMAIAGVGCLSTAFHLDVDMDTVALTALIFAVLTALFIRLRRGWLLLVLTALCGAWLLHSLDFSYNFYSLLNEILTLFDRGYGWGIPDFIAQCDDWDLTLSMQTIAAISAMFAGIYLSHCLHSLATLSVLLPVLPCIVLTDTVPSGEYLLLAILVVALLALTQYARRTDSRQANRLTALLLIPLLLAGMVLFQQFPQSDYRPLDISEDMFQLMEQLAEKIPFLNQTPGQPDTPSHESSATVNLSTAGPRPTGSTKMLQIVASQTGPLYLRGRSYTDYTGLTWEAMPGTETMLQPGAAYVIEHNQTIQIQALQSQHVQYFPYYPGKLTLSDGALESEPQETYLYSYRPLRGDWQRLWQKQHGSLTVDNSAYAAALEKYTQLPYGTADLALIHLDQAGVIEQNNIVQIAEKVGNYVRESAEYDLNTGRMPTMLGDFALWFLDHSETGYCIHFASAATVLLRAAGIPARYVEGYLVDAVAGQPTPVLSENAHAWVEYYVPDLGWVILEATPSDGLPIVVPTQPTTPNQTTRPTEPTEPTDPTGPTEPTEPTEPTGPTIPTGPTKPTEPTTPTEPTEPTEPTTPSQTTQPTEPTLPQGSTVPGISGPGEGPGNADFDWSPWLSVLKWFGTLLALAAFIIGQWQLRLRLRRKWMEGTTFVHILRRWRYACHLAQLCRHQEPKPLLELVKKAKFSRNGLNDRELRQFDRYYAACIRGFKKTPWYVRMVLRVVLAAW